MRLWSTQLDLWGTIDQKNEKTDRKWCFPTDFKTKELNDVLDKVKEILDDIPVDGTDAKNNNKNIIY